MLQYALLHLFDYKVTLDDLKAFRVSTDPHPIKILELANKPSRL